jgi:hypothetical protein
LLVGCAAHTTPRKSWIKKREAMLSRSREPRR